MIQLVLALSLIAAPADSDRDEKNPAWNSSFDNIPHSPMEDALNQKIFALTPLALTAFGIMITATGGWTPAQILIAFGISVPATLATYHYHFHVIPRRKHRNRVVEGAGTLVFSLVTTACGAIIANLAH